MNDQRPTAAAHVGTSHVVGVDVGTGSARAGIFDLAGRMVGSAKQDISLFHATGGIVEQSSAEIWDAVCGAVRAAMAQAELAASQVIGIGFDATCSLVVMPLTFLGGPFYSIDMLPPMWQKLSMLNPSVYLIAGFRWSFFDSAELHAGISFSVTLAFFVVSLAFATWIVRSGWRLKN